VGVAEEAFDEVMGLVVAKIAEKPDHPSSRMLKRLLELHRPVAHPTRPGKPYCLACATVSPCAKLADLLILFKLPSAAVEALAKIPTGTDPDPKENPMITTKKQTMRREQAIDLLEVASAKASEAIDAVVDKADGWLKKPEAERVKGIRSFAQLGLAIYLYRAAPKKLVELTTTLAALGLAVPVLDRKQATSVWRPVAFLITALAFRASSAVRATKTEKD
jgi:hypothetical protein